MKLLLSIFFLSTGNYLIAQQQTFDIATYTAPSGWKKQSSQTSIQYSKENATANAYCIIMLFKAIPTDQNAKVNFDAAWQTVVKETVSVTAQPEMQPSATENGWEVKSGYAPFENDGQKG